MIGGAYSYGTTIGISAYLACTYGGRILILTGIKSHLGIFIKYPGGFLSKGGVNMRHTDYAGRDSRTGKAAD